MKKKQRFTPFFRRTLCVVLSFWLMFMLVLAVNNYDRAESQMENAIHEQGRQLRINADLAITGTAPWERKSAILSERLSSYSYYNHHAISVYRLFDANGKELARSQLTRGSVSPQGTGVYSIYLQFDPVFSKEEHIAFAKKLQQEDSGLGQFYGYDTPDYGEVTGILEENVIYPQKIVYYCEENTIVVMESDNPMFDGVELTTVRFDGAGIYSSLVSDELPPEKLWDLYWEAEGQMERMLADYTPSLSGSVTVVGGNTRARMSNYYDLPGYPLASASVYTPLTMMTDGLGWIYILSFFDALLITWYISHTHQKFRKRERELTRAVAHEFKTPAAVIRAYAEALEADISPEKRKEYLNTLIEEADRMGVMVGELVELSRLSDQSPKLEKREVNLKALTYRCFERLRLPMEERGLEPELFLEPCTCMGDEKQLERAVSNLALNVLYHAKPGAVTIWLSADNVLTVENCCDPIPPNILQRLWEPFYKGDSSRSGEGSGLGLAIVEHIVHLHGGSCLVENTETGVRFRICVPAY